MKKKLLNLGMAALLGCGLAGCGEQPAAPESGSIATPTPEWTEETDVSTEPVITEGEEEEISLYTSANEALNELAEQTIVLENDDEIAEQRDIDLGCFRVTVTKKNVPATAEKYRRDYFFFDEKDPVALMVDYSVRGDYGVERQVYDACDFEARREDVNFDGHKDLQIALGQTAGDRYWCTYLYEDGEYRYVPSFETIVNYEADPDAGAILSNYMVNGLGMLMFYRYNDSTGIFEGGTSFSVSDSIRFKLIAEMIYYSDESHGFTDGAMNYAIASTLGLHLVKEDHRILSDGSSVYPDRTIDVSELEAFYRDVLGMDKSFPAGYEDGSEVGITCQRNGLAYAYNGIGWGEYGVITDVKETENGYEISADIWNDISGSKEAGYTFLLTTSDNMYGYTLDWDSVDTDF